MNREELKSHIQEWLKPLTREEYDALKSKFYYSGRGVKIGDYVNYGFLIEPHSDTSSTLTLISYHFDEVDTIYRVKEMRTKFAPALEIIGSKE
jgi:hypothetical protein